MKLNNNPEKKEEQAVLFTNSTSNEEGQRGVVAILISKKPLGMSIDREVNC